MKQDIIQILKNVHDHRLPVPMAYNEIADVIGEENLKKNGGWVIPVSMLDKYKKDDDSE